ncbi:MarR family winged helix-turn-helix transcriptional regulator [Aeromicrobium sp. CTD01-1L150]|uniref:MarR family winged helix-turn-helix transcriptional regulator n=1 Tax=Aeromicrobium sp. CTD01-1L150 TaxID=3341830 RepID=UPI0035C1F3B0
MTFDVTLPLPTLLGRVQATFAAEYDHRLAERGLRHLSLSLGTNVMRHLSRDDGVRLSTLVEVSGVSKQAISQQVTHLQAHGYVQVEPDPADSRAKLVRLTESGHRSLLEVRPIFAEVEKDWHDRFGSEEVRALRRALEHVLLTLGDTGVAPRPKDAPGP